MVAAEYRNYARAYLQKATEYLASAEDNLVLERFTPAAGDAIHAGISAKDAIVMALAGAGPKSKDHSTAARELRMVLAPRPSAAGAEKALRELIAAKADVEYGTVLVGVAKAEPLVRRASTLVALAEGIVKLGR